MNRLAKNWINGEWVDSHQHMQSINPATYEVIGQYANATIEQVQSAIWAAKKALKETDWKRDRRLRAKVLNEMADAFERHTDELIEILATENGKIKPEATFEVTMVPAKLRSVDFN